MSEEDKRAYLEFAKQIACEAGEIMRKYFSVTDTVWKGDNTPVTQADTEINTMVIERVQAKYPDHSVLGEEQSISADSRYTWVCDPVDGTMPYSHGLQISSFSLALCEDGVPQVGVVYDPFGDRLFYAAVGSGAFCNDRPIHVNDNTLHNALINLEGVRTIRRVLDLKPEFHEQLTQKGVKVTSMWSAVLPTALVASGSLTATIFNVWKPEDGAANRVIVEEAGGKFTSLRGDDQRYDQPVYGYVASNGVVHDELVEMLRDMGVESDNWRRKDEV